MKAILVPVFLTQLPILSLPTTLHRLRSYSLMKQNFLAPAALGG